MHLSVQFNHFKHALLDAVRCEVSKAMPAVAEASEATCMMYACVGYSQWGMVLLL